MIGELIVENLIFKDVLKGINFTLKEGTITALMGKSGSGKTILLKSLMGLIECEGIINVSGTVVTKNNIEKMTKNFGLYLGISNLENKTSFSNIIEPLDNLNYSNDRSRKRVYEVSKKLGIENLLYKEVHQLTHSQKKVVSFAQSIIHNPRVILIDGLFDSLDTYYKNKVVTYLKQLKKSKNCIIIFTTNNSEDLWIADNLIIVKGGKVSAIDSVKKLIENDSLFLKNDIKLPFLVDLSYKLKAYDLIARLIYNIDEMVDEIWQ